MYFLFKIKCCQIIDVILTLLLAMVYISVFFSLLVLRFPVLLEFDQGNVIARDREMRESARKGSQDKAALCCSFALFLLLLAQQTLHT